jgi:hypothetical protein
MAQSRPRGIRPNRRGAPRTARTAPGSRTAGPRHRVPHKRSRPCVADGEHVARRFFRVLRLLTTHRLACARSPRAHRTERARRPRRRQLAQHLGFFRRIPPPLPNSLGGGVGHLRLLVSALRGRQRAQARG